MSDSTRPTLLVLLALFSLAMGCPRSSAPPEPAAPAGPICFTPEHQPDLASCQANLPAGYGGPESPLEWGEGGAGELWFGRLRCANGRIPVGGRVGSLGEPQTASSSPPSPLAPVLMDGPDRLDHWRLSCGPDSPALELAVNPYRCGNPCPPPGLQLLPVESVEWLMEAAERSDLGDHPAALAAIDHALELDPQSEYLWFQASMYRGAAEEFEAALGALDKALEFSPGDPNYRLLRGVCLQELGRPADYLAVLDELGAEFAADHPAQADLDCRRSMAHEALGDTELAEQLRERACAAGATFCCEGGAEGGDHGGHRH